MKKVIQLITLVAFSLFLANCAKEKEDNTGKLGILLLLSGSNKGSAGAGASALSPTQQMSTSVSASVSSAASAATSAVGGTAGTSGTAGAGSAPSAFLDEIHQNGKDPYFIKSRLQEYAKKTALNKNKASLETKMTALTGTSSGTPTTTAGVTTYNYTFAGTLDGSGSKVGTYDIGRYIPSVGACTISFIGRDPSAKQGVATFTNGTGSWSNTSATGTSSYKGGISANIAFADYGTFWYDEYSYYKLLKQYIGSGANTATTSSTPISSLSCADLKSVYNMIYTFWNHSKFTGNIVTSYNYNYSYGYSSSGSTYTYTYTGDNTSKTTTPSLTISLSSLVGSTIASVPSTITDTDITYNQKYNFSSSFSSGSATTTSTASSYTYTGSYTFVISGKINGSAINDTLTITF
ncbi:MAG TPA: hypothetical protein PLG41_23005 [Leptospiraceae bacterium]|nr:hypothetical protein [Leptospiraceae bacterium]